MEAVAAGAVTEKSDVGEALTRHRRREGALVVLPGNGSGRLSRKCNLSFPAFSALGQIIALWQVDSSLHFLRIPFSVPS